MKTVSCSLLCLVFALLLRSADAAPPPPKTGAVFQDVTAAMGLTLGGDSACWADVDNDGWVDLCVGGVVWKNNAGKISGCELSTGGMIGTIGTTQVTCFFHEPLSDTTTFHCKS